MRHQLADLEFQIKKTTDPDDLARLHVKRRDQIAGLRLVTPPKD